MFSDRQNTSAARPPLDRADVWVIEPELNLGFAGRLRELWRYRRILLFFATKAFAQLYKNTKLGVGWLVLRPLAPILVGTLVFGGLMEVPSQGTPYFLFLLTGSIAWSLFADPLTRASRGLESNRVLLTKLYIPRVILPAGQLAAGLVEPIVLSGVLLGALWYYRASAGVWYGAPLERLPVALAAAAMAVTLAFAVSLWTSVWQARARDVRYMLSYVVNFGMFLTPVVYPLSMMPADARWLAVFNPMTAPVEAFRWAVIGGGSPGWFEALISAGWTTLILTTGFWYFARSESGTVDKL